MRVQELECLHDSSLLSSVAVRIRHGTYGGVVFRLSPYSELDRQIRRVLAETLVCKPPQ